MVEIQENIMYKNIKHKTIEFLTTNTHISVQVAKYIISGGTAAFAEFLILYVFTEFFGIWYIYSVLIAFLFAFCVSFIMQKFWTFKDKNTNKTHKQAAFYLFISVVNLIVNVIAIYILVEVFELWYMLAQVLIAGVTAIYSFLIYKFIIFKHDKSHINS